MHLSHDTDDAANQSRATPLTGGSADGGSPSTSGCQSGPEDAMTRERGEAQERAQAAEQAGHGATQQNRRRRVGTSEAALVAPAWRGRTTSDARPAVEGATTGAVELSEDHVLVRRALAGDQEAFTTLVEKYKDPVYNVAYRMLGNPTEAEDVAQETFVRAYTQLRTYKEAHRFSTWLLSIASHLSIDQLRRRRFLALPLENVPFLDWIADLAVGPEQAAVQGETSDEMQGLLQQLPPKYRAVLILRYWHDLSYEEIANALRLTPALVKARLHRARELVARRMRAQGLDLGADSELNDGAGAEAAGSDTGPVRKGGATHAAATP